MIEEWRTRCPKCGAERDPVSDKYPTSVTFYECGRCVYDGKPSEYNPVNCRIRELERSLAASREECERLKKALLGHLFDGESLSLREAIRSQAIVEMGKELASRDRQIERLPVDTKEAVYDREINPLMAKIIAICKEHKIAALCNFRLDEDLQCTTALLDGEYEPSEDQLRAYGAITQGTHSFAAFTITSTPKQ